MYVLEFLNNHVILIRQNGALLALIPHDSVLSNVAIVYGQIMENGKAYAMEGDVYFSVDSFPEYLSLSGRKLDQNQAGARVAFDTRKRNPADFALWKVSFKY